jgi:hypothetical protein
MPEITMETKQYLFPVIRKKGEGGVLSDFIEEAERILRGHSEYKEINTENKFKKIMLYNSIDEPYYQSQLIYDYLRPGKKGHNQWIKDHFIEKIGNNLSKFIRKLNIYIPKSNIPIEELNKCNEKDYKKGNEIWMLTEMGLNRALNLITTEFSVTFQELILNYLREMKKNHLEIHKKIIKEKGRELEAERAHIQELEIINNESIQLREAFHNPGDFGDQDKTELTILRREHQKQFFMYVVDWEYMNAKFWRKYPPIDQTKVTKISRKNQVTSTKNYNGIEFSSDSDEDSAINEKKSNTKKIYDITEPHDKGIDEPYELFCLDSSDLENNENQEYYFCIKAKEITGKKKEFYKFIEYINIKDTKHYKAMIDIINNGNRYNHKTSYPLNAELVENTTETEMERNLYKEEISTPESDVFKKCYSEIIDARNTSFINLHVHVLKDGNKKFRKF